LPRERERIIIRGFDNISRGGNIFFCVQDFVPFPYCTFSDVRWAVLGCAGLYLQPFFLFAGLYVCDKRWECVQHPTHIFTFSRESTGSDAQVMQQPSSSSFSSSLFFRLFIFVLCL
jgi:hypothetical protein